MCPQGKSKKPPDVRLFSFIDLPDVLTLTRKDTHHESNTREAEKADTWLTKPASG
jgi:hypothetical protein